MARKNKTKLVKSSRSFSRKRSNSKQTEGFFDSRHSKLSTEFLRSVVEVSSGPVSLEDVAKTLDIQDSHDIKKLLYKLRVLVKNNLLNLFDNKFSIPENDNLEPLVSRDNILKVIRKEKSSLTASQIAKHTETKKEMLEALEYRLMAMVRDAQLIRLNKKFSLALKQDLNLGEITVNKDGKRFFSSKDINYTNVMIAKTDFSLFAGDKVLAYISVYKDENSEVKEIASVHKIVEKKIEVFTGKYVEGQEGKYIIPLKRSLGYTPITCSSLEVKVNSGDIVLAQLVRDNLSTFEENTAKVIKLLGDEAGLSKEIEGAIYNFEIPHEWPSTVASTAKNLPVEVKDNDKEGRYDLRSLPLITIDGEDARDFDDAIYCEKREKGGWRLFVAVADVSHYVKKNSHLDKEALIRGNSTYFPGFVIPMLPEELSNGLCSLNPHVDRLCMVCEMNISESGRITRHYFYPAVMHSHARMTYSEVASIIEGHEDLRLKHSSIVNYIDDLNSLYQVLKEQRKKRGAIEFDTQEKKFLFNDKGEIESVVTTDRKVSHCIVEECMLCANVSAAKFLYKEKIPFLRRVHPKPDPIKIVELLQYLKHLNLNINLKNDFTAKEYTYILDEIKERDDYQVIQMMILRSLSQAYYSSDNEEHFGLGYEHYTHFTSPIRRYTDLMIHRAIKDKLNKIKISDDEKEELNNNLEFLGEHLSDRERNSDAATKDAFARLKCKFASTKLSQAFDGVITTVTNFGLFVEIKELNIDGLIHIKSLDKDYFIFDEKKHRLLGESSGLVYSLGDTLKVKISSVDQDSKKIDLKLISVIQSKSNGNKTARKNFSKKRKPSSSRKKSNKRGSDRKTSIEHKKKTKSGKAKVKNKSKTKK